MKSLFLRSGLQKPDLAIITCVTVLFPFFGALALLVEQFITNGFLSVCVQAVLILPFWIIFLYSIHKIDNRWPRAPSPTTGESWQDEWGLRKPTALELAIGFLVLFIWIGSLLGLGFLFYKFFKFIGDTL